MSEVFNILIGGVNIVEIENLGIEIIIVEGKEISVICYCYIGDFDVDVWYDSDGRWVKFEFFVEDCVLVEKDNLFIEYVCVWCGQGS